MTTTPFQRLAIAIASGAVLAAGLSACVPLVVGGAAAVGVGMVATDRRSSGAQLDDQGIELRAAARGAGAGGRPPAAAGAGRARPRASRGPRPRACARSPTTRCT